MKQPKSFMEKVENKVDSFKYEIAAEPQNTRKRGADKN